MSDFVIPAWFEIGSLVVLSLILIADLLLVVRRPHVPSPRESALWVGFYVALALVFAGLMFAFVGPQAGGEFVAGWLTEYSLSVDNLFVFLLIMAKFQVPKQYQQEMLMLGIIVHAVCGTDIIVQSARATVSDVSMPGGCNGCEADVNVLNTLVFDLGRFGIQFVASPRHADVLFSISNIGGTLPGVFGVAVHVLEPGVDAFVDPVNFSAEANRFFAK